MITAAVVKSPLRAKPLRILTVCQGGQVRSVALKYLLTYKHGHECLACGWQSNSAETRAALYAWADYIVVLQSEFAAHIPAEFHTRADGSRKLFAYDVGEDRYGNPFHKELQSGLESMIAAHGLFA